MTSTSSAGGRSTDPHFVVLGASGGIGRAVVAEATARGFRVRAVSRNAVAAARISPFPSSVDVQDADLSTPAGARAAVAGATVVVHAAQPAYTRWPQEFPALTSRIADATAAAGAKLVVADNLYMYGPQPDGRPMSETTPYAATDRKGRVRAAMATELLDRHRRGDLRVTLGRASDYYGPHGTGSALGDAFVGVAAAGKTVNIIGSGTTLHTMAYLPDLAAGLLTLAEHDTADGKAWHLAAAEPVTARRFTDFLAAALGRPLKVRTSSATTLRLLGLANPTLRELATITYQWQQPFVSDDAAYRAAFPDAAQVTPHREAVAATAAWFQQRAHPQDKPAT